MWQAHHKYLVTGIILVFLIRGGEREKVKWRGGGRDRGRDGAVCQSIVPLGDQRGGETEGFVKIFVSHSVPPHGKFGKHEEGWGGSLICNERDKLRGFKPVP